MHPIPFIPLNAPFNTEQRAWINGYLAGLFADATRLETTPPTPPPSQSLLVIYGSQTGTGEQLAKKVAKEATKRGFVPKLMEANNCSSTHLAQERYLILVTSTWGDGEAPDNAANFWTRLSDPSTPRLDHLSYSVLALGDKNYSDFCGAGKKFDERFKNLGAVPMFACVECDTDYEAMAKAWMENLWVALESAPKELGTEPVPSHENTAPTPSPLDAQYSRKNPFSARLVTNHRLNGARSAKDTRHLEISLEGSGLSYEVGDALGVFPQNCPLLVDEILKLLSCHGDESVAGADGNPTPFRDALLKDYQITHPPIKLLTTMAQHSNNATLLRLLKAENKAELDQFLHGREVVDLLAANSQWNIPPAEFTSLLRKLQPRLYSIASSPKAHPLQVHLTVAALRYESHGRPRKGVCSTWLADRADDGISVPIFIQKSHGFRLPTDPSRDVIMIGPGTGIAPFRAFLEERRETRATGANWLFFGDQQRESDFLYEAELMVMREQGTLARLDLAFSRDQQEKIYVQHRMLESAQTLFEWLERGAHLYICGDAKRMAKDVDQTLHEIIQKVGGKSSEESSAYVQNLKIAKRYQRDVY